MPQTDTGLYLRFRVEGPLVIVEAATPISRWSRSLLRAPLLTPDTYARIAAPGAETVVSLLDSQGRVLAAFGFPEQPKVFFDRKAREERRGLAGLTGDPSQKLREISVPFPAGTSFLYFYRSQCTLAQDARLPRVNLEQRFVALYSTARPGEESLPAPRLWIPAPRGATPARLPWLPSRDERQGR